MTSSLVACFENQFSTHAESRTFTFLHESGRKLVSDVLTFGELSRDAREIAVWLSDNTEADRPVLLLFEPGLDFWRSFLGCIFAGRTAIPAPLPHDQRSMQRVASILSNSGANLALTSTSLRDLFVGGIAALDLDDPIEILAVEDAHADSADWTPPDITDDFVAFLQYTSGSTGDPKGVAVTHGNVMNNEAAMTAAMDLSSEDSAVIWIPHFHDMGLLGVMLAFYNGGNLVLMSPMAFLKQPVRLLQAIHDYRGTVSAGPNFSYDLISRRVTPEQIADLDLSCWRYAINGAEPVRARTIDRFTETLAPAGFAPTTMRPAFGMAEVTLMATICRGPANYLTADPAALEQHRFVPATGQSITLVSSGAPAPGVGVLVVDPDTLDILPEDAVGEIWLSGDSVASGYHNRPVETAESFHAVTSSGEGPFLRTGDLGLFHGSELYVTGRRKDLLIVNGRNLYPQDIEEYVQDAHPAITGSRGVAVSLDASDSERLVLIQAIRPELLGDITLPELAAKMKVAIARGFEIPAPSVVLVERSAIHLTTSGKVQRSSMKAAFRSGGLTGVLLESLDSQLTGSGVR